jgi:hypothetical protein
MTDKIEQLRLSYLKQLEEARKKRNDVLEEMRFLEKRIEQLTGAVFALEKAQEIPNEQETQNDPQDTK